MKGRIALVLMGFALLSIGPRGQTNTASYWDSTGMDEQVLPILVNDSSPQFALDKYPFFVLEGFANWCDNCMEMNVTLSELSSDLMGQVAFGQINAEKNNDTSEKYNITAYPTTLIFKNGIFVGIHEGYQSVPEFIRTIKKQEPDLDISKVKVTAEEWFNDGVAHYDQGDYNNSIDAYGKAFELEPQNESIWNNCGLGLYYLSRYGEATIGINTSDAEAAFTRAKEWGPASNSSLRSSAKAAKWMLHAFGLTIRAVATKSK